MLSYPTYSKYNPCNNRPPDVRSWLIWKDPDAGKDWGQEEKGMTEDEMVEWCHQLDGHGFGWTLWVGDGQGGLVCCGSWGHKESDTTKQLNWTELDKFLTEKESGIFPGTFDNDWRLFGDIITGVGDGTIADGI